MNLIKDGQHLKEIHNLYSKADELIIVSPFLSINSKLKLDKNKKLIIITKDVNGINSIDNERQNFIKFLLDKNFEFKLYDVENLHSKIYLFKNKGKCFAAIVSSANFTSKGLSGNKEYGVLISENENLKKIESYVVDLMKTRAIEVEELKNKIQDFIEKSKSKKDSSKLEVDRDELKREKWYWLKPLGDSDQNKQKDFDLQKLFNDCINSDVCLFKNSMGEIKKGDVLICYLTGAMQVVYKCVVNADKFTASTDKRWDKQVDINHKKEVKKLGNPITKEREYNLKDLQENYFKLKQENAFIDAKGRKDFVGVCRRDRLLLDKDFAEYIIKECFPN